MATYMAGMLKVSTSVIFSDSNSRFIHNWHIYHLAYYNRAYTNSFNLLDISCVVSAFDLYLLFFTLGKVYTNSSGKWDWSIHSILLI